VGAIDGKHFRIKCPPKSGSTFFNYKCFFSIVLMASVDADGLFTTVDVGEVGRNSDAGVFRSSGLGRCLESGTLNLPSPKPLPSTNNNEHFPFYFVVDEAFPLKFLQIILINTNFIIFFYCIVNKSLIKCSYL